MPCLYVLILNEIIKNNDLYVVIVESIFKNIYLPVFNYLIFFSKIKTLTLQFSTIIHTAVEIRYIGSDIFSVCISLIYTLCFVVCTQKSTCSAFLKHYHSYRVEIDCLSCKRNGKADSQKKTSAFFSQLNFVFCFNNKLSQKMNRNIKITLFVLLVCYLSYSFGKFHLLITFNTR